MQDGQRKETQKEKVVEASTSWDVSKKRKTTGIEMRDAEMEAAGEQRHQEMLDAMADDPRKFVWEKGPLNKQPVEFQPKLFYEKMEDDHSIMENMCFKKAVLSLDFKALGFFEMFTALGWEAMVSFRRNTGGEVHMKSVMDWISTLKKDDGSIPPRTITLIGTVNNKPVTLYPATLRQLAKFHSKADSFYRIVDANNYHLHTEKLVEDNTMLSELFMLEKGFEMK
ncbi:hypothetical protein Hdeb2414_s0011g00367671 [Helianthus debilis subsp. tardiflorus]